MRRRRLLRIDAGINLFLGGLLLLYLPFAGGAARLLGVPLGGAFYPSLLGGVFVGIGIALLFEAADQPERKVRGLGLHGACVINLCGGAILAGWLLFGQLRLPARGLALLWGLTFVLVVLSGLELAAEAGRRKDSRRP